MQLKLNVIRHMHLPTWNFVSLLCLKNMIASSLKFISTKLDIEIQHKHAH